MSLFNDLPEGVCRPNAPLAPLTWFRLGGPADYLLEPQTLEQVALILHRCRETGTPLRILGLGANILVPDEGVRGAVMRLSGPHFGAFRIEGESIHAGAGADMTMLVKRAVREGLAGLEQLAGIPGTVGGGICMNCGGKFGDFSSAVRSVRVIDVNGEIRERSAGSLGFTYRTCELGSDIVLEATLDLHADDPETVGRRFREVWQYKQSSQPPMGAHSAGCIFRNPNGHSAGQLIDRAGLKGLRIGSAHVSQRHANFAMADEGGRAADVRKLIETIIARVESDTGIRLEPEVKLW